MWALLILLPACVLPTYHISQARCEQVRESLKAEQSVCVSVNLPPQQNR